MPAEFSGHFFSYSECVFAIPILYREKQSACMKGILIRLLRRRKSLLIAVALCVV